MVQMLTLSYGLCGFNSGFQPVVILLLGDNLALSGDIGVVTAVGMLLAPSG